MYWLMSISVLVAGLFWNRIDWLVVSILFGLIDIIDTYIRHKYPEVTKTVTRKYPVALKNPLSQDNTNQ